MRSGKALTRCDSPGEGRDVAHLGSVVVGIGTGLAMLILRGEVKGLGSARVALPTPEEERDSSAGEDGDTPNHAPNDGSGARAR